MQGKYKLLKEQNFCCIFLDLNIPNLGIKYYSTHLRAKEKCYISFCKNVINNKKRLGKKERNQSRITHMQPKADIHICTCYPIFSFLPFSFNNVEFQSDISFNSGVWAWVLKKKSGTQPVFHFPPFFLVYTKCLLFFI